ncbi:PREDICTED: uncharacterized protein LOC105360752 [Ceratosolen solmsi marchali]|uniref:Uncharacterized protein LOC105360752 n=1 Tax=Ceratosolen solmsi marchali TaxID=326594 RepID=A0AAJ7DTC9_9HYME|nr:PREDICTED: uncharacterized protein LOC105360752 [Ceratosolen solmsi marchali]
MLPWSLAAFALYCSILILGVDGRCGDRLERALGLMQQRGAASRRGHEAEDPRAVYHQRLRSAPIDVSVTKLSVEIPQSSIRDGPSWAKVERCAYEPSTSSIRSRVGFKELAVSGLVELLMAYGAGPKKVRLPAESCRVSLRLRRAGMEFYASPIARGRGQMRVRTESSFLEPRFASIYAYGCRALATSPPSHDRNVVESSEPRERGPANDDSSDHLQQQQQQQQQQQKQRQWTSSDSNIVSNSSAFESEEPTEEENRLGASLDPIFGSANDALLDSLWRSRGDIAREMEDVFLRSASQAITHYIEKQLHPAIKETLLLSMGYTISYG